MSQKKNAQGEQHGTILAHEDLPGVPNQSLTDDPRHQTLLTAVFEADPSGVAVLTGAELRFAYVNPAYRYIIPNPKIDPLGKTYARVWPGKKQHVAPDRFRQVLETGKPFQLTGLEFRFPDGEQRIFTLQARRLEWDGKPAVLLILWDVTEQKLALEAQRESNVRLAALMEAATGLLAGGDPIARLNDFFYQFSNRLGLEIYVQYNLSQDGTYLELGSWAGFPEKYKKFLNRLELGQAVCGTVALTRQPMYVNHVQSSEDPKTRLIRRMGISTYACHPLMVDGRLLGTLSFGSRRLDQFEPETIELLRTFCHLVAEAMDRKRIEKHLRESELQFTEALESTNDRFMAIDKNWKILYANSRLASAVGCTAQDLIGKNLWEVFPRYLGTVAEDGYRKAMQGRVPTSFYSPGIYAAGWFEVSVYPTGDGISIFGKDLSEENLAEQALRESEASLRRAQEIAHLGSWDLNVETERLTWSDEVYRIFGIEPRAFAGSYQSFLEVVHPGDRLAVDDAYKSSIRDGSSSYEIDHRIIRQDTGETRYVHEKCEHIRNSAGQVIRSVGMVQDITAYKQAEGQIHLQTTALSAAANGVVITDRDGTIEWANPAFTALTGYTLEEAVGKNPRDLVKSGVQDQDYYHSMWQLLLSGQVWRGEIVNRRKDGSHYYEDMTITPVIGDQGEITHFIAIKQNISDQKAFEQALHESAFRERTRVSELETMMNTVPAFVWVSRDVDCREMISNQYGYDFLNMQPGSNVSMTAPEGQKPAHHQAMRDGKVIQGEEMPMQIAARTGIPQFDYEFDLVFDNGSTYNLFGNAAPLFDAEGNPSGAVGVFIDVTELKKAGLQAQILEAENEIKHRLIEQREQERLQIARDLHDGPIQDLLALEYTLQGIQDRLQSQPDLLHELAEVQKNLAQQVAELRTFTGGLRPPALAPFGLEKAIRSYLETFQENHPEISIEFEAQQSGDLLPEPTRLALFRILQEALNNILKHAHASKVSVRFQKDESQTILAIHDNGVGFQFTEDWVGLARQGHLGLVGMRERVEAVGGTLTIASQSSGGTLLRAVVLHHPL